MNLIRNIFGNKEANQTTGKRYRLKSPGECEIGNETVFLDHGTNDSEFRGKRRSDAYYMAKPTGYIEAYDELLKTPGFGTGLGINMLEVGIFAGGSTVFMDKYFKPKRLVAVDYMPQSAPALDRYISEGNSDRVAAYYGVDQSDRRKMIDIFEKNFDSPLDFVIDDASHFYRESRATFEAIFPFLRPGAIYVLEDWSWAHGAGAEDPNHYWADQQALTNLVYQFVSVHGTDPGIITRLGCLTGFTWVQRGPGDLPKSGWTLDPYLKPRGKEINLI